MAFLVNVDSVGGKTINYLTNYVIKITDNNFFYKIKNPPPPRGYIHSNPRSQIEIFLFRNYEKNIYIDGYFIVNVDSVPHSKNGF